MRIYDEHSNTRLNPAAEEWRPEPQPSPILVPLPLQLVTQAPAPPLVQLFQAPPQYHLHHHHVHFYPPLPQPPVYHDLPLPSIDEDPLKVEDEISRRDHGIKRSSCRKVLPPRLRRASTAKNLQQPPPPPPPKQERPRRRNKLPVSDRPPQKQHWKRKSVSGQAVAAAASQLPASRSNSPRQTTVMIKNIPYQLRRDYMLKFVENYCQRYSLFFDFLYLPMDFGTLGNLGYAFVNFTTPAAARKFKNAVRNYKWRPIYTKNGESVICSKVVETAWARTQGILALRRRFKDSFFDCNDLNFLPVELDPPRNGSDPNPPPPVILGRLCGSGK